MVWYIYNGIKDVCIIVYCTTSLSMYFFISNLSQNLILITCIGLLKRNMNLITNDNSSKVRLWNS